MTDKTHLIDLTEKRTTACGMLTPIDNPLLRRTVEDVTCKKCLAASNKAAAGRRDEVCQNCGNPILMAIFKSGLYCCENCRKALVKAGVLDDD